MCCQQRGKSTWGPQGHSSTGAFPGSPAVALGNLCKSRSAASCQHWMLRATSTGAYAWKGCKLIKETATITDVSCPLQFPTLLNGHMPVPLPSLDRAASPVLLSSSSQKSWWPQESRPSHRHRRRRHHRHRCRRSRQQLSTQNSRSQFVPMG